MRGDSVFAYTLIPNPAGSLRISAEVVWRPFLDAIFPRPRDAIFPEIRIAPSHHHADDNQGRKAELCAEYRVRSKQFKCGVQCLHGRSTAKAGQSPCRRSAFVRWLIERRPRRWNHRGHGSAVSESLTTACVYPPRLMVSNKPPKSAHAFLPESYPKSHAFYTPCRPRRAFARSQLSGATRLLGYARSLTKSTSTGCRLALRSRLYSLFPSRSPLSWLHPKAQP